MHTRTLFEKGFVQVEKDSCNRTNTPVQKVLKKERGKLRYERADKKGKLNTKKRIDLPKRRGDREVPEKPHIVIQLEE